SLAFLPLFFYCYGDPRGLHSFPTRRSSDLLPNVAAVGDGMLGRIGPTRPWARRYAPLSSDSRRNRSRSVGRVTIVRRIAERAPRDRKSTRLNSSHDQISYAVFCLKKKNILL